MAIDKEDRKLSFGELCGALRELIQAGKTGTLYLLTDAKRYARIGLKQGRIAQLVVGKYRGAEALEHLQQIRFASCSFAEDVVSGTSEFPLPPTAALMQWLEDSVYAIEGQGATLETRLPSSADLMRGSVGEASVESTADIPETLRGLLGTGRVTEPAAKTPYPREAASGGGSQPPSLFGQGLYETVNRELALFLGPIAPMITTNYRNDLLTVATRDGLDRVLRDIGEEIGDPTQAERFRRSVLGLATG